jgi:hypothetical protein
VLAIWFISLAVGTRYDNVERTAVSVVDRGRSIDTSVHFTADVRHQDDFSQINTKTTTFPALVRNPNNSLLKVTGT